MLLLSNQMINRSRVSLTLFTNRMLLLRIPSDINISCIHTTFRFILQANKRLLVYSLIPRRYKNYTCFLAFSLFIKTSSFSKYLYLFIIILSFKQTRHLINLARLRIDFTANLLLFGEYLLMLWLGLVVSSSSLRGFQGKWSSIF